MQTEENLDKAAVDYATMTYTFSEDCEEMALYKAFLAGAKYVMNNMSKD